jgi:hypothetical protein
MMAFPSMLVGAAEKAGIKIPSQPDGKWKSKDFPHFHIFCNVQLCRPIRWGEHWENAEVIAAIPETELESIKLGDLIARGLHYIS